MRTPEYSNGNKHFRTKNKTQQENEKTQLNKQAFVQAQKGTVEFLGNRKERFSRWDFPHTHTVQRKHTATPFGAFFLFYLSAVIVYRHKREHPQIFYFFLKGDVLFGVDYDHLLHMKNYRPRISLLTYCQLPAQRDKFRILILFGNWREYLRSGLLIPTADCLLRNVAFYRQTARERKKDRRELFSAW